MRGPGESAPDSSGPLRSLLADAVHAGLHAGADQAAVAAVVRIRGRVDLAAGRGHPVAVGVIRVAEPDDTLRCRAALRRVRQRADETAAAAVVDVVRGVDLAAVRGVDVAVRLAGGADAHASRTNGGRDAIGVGPAAAAERAGRTRAAAAIDSGLGAVLEAVRAARLALARHAAKRTALEVA